MPISQEVITQTAAQFVDYLKTTKLYGRWALGGRTLKEPYKTMMSAILAAKAVIPYAGNVYGPIYDSNGESITNALKSDAAWHDMLKQKLGSMPKATIGSPHGEWWRSKCNYLCRAGARYEGGCCPEINASVVEYVLDNPRELLKNKFRYLTVCTGTHDFSIISTGPTMFATHIILDAWARWAYPVRLVDSRHIEEFIPHATAFTFDLKSPPAKKSWGHFRRAKTTRQGRPPGYLISRSNFFPEAWNRPGENARSYKAAEELIEKGLPDDDDTKTVGIVQHLERKIATLNKFKKPTTGCNLKLEMRLDRL